MDSGGTNDMRDAVPGERPEDQPGQGPARHSGERELSTGVAVLAAVVAALGAAAVLLAVFHWLGWTVPGLGWLLAKGAVKLCAGGAFGLVAGLAWLRQRRSGRE
ncbi:hypothetical protein ACFVHB_30490 [Kitasatospora sp. NPDC127111]|uniref:hypothetical protein n=1 Tax=Kitasatospora sp. NPDC127111 TaxID=3345363 RepID=UPI00362DAEC2